jgi:hypothetical protein
VELNIKQLFGSTPVNGGSVQELTVAVENIARMKADVQARLNDARSQRSNTIAVLGDEIRAISALTEQF